MVTGFPAKMLEELLFLLISSSLISVSFLKNRLFTLCLSLQGKALTSVP